MDSLGEVVDKGLLYMEYTFKRSEIPGKVYCELIFQNLKDIQWNPSYEAIPLAPKLWPFKRGGISSGVEIHTYVSRFTLSSGLPRWVGFQKGFDCNEESNVP